ncbi:PREDICTED: intraflagellar transport protein 81 homolog [Priapulus caudatus]|uniref:Intraflagellar transport protein 81 homolog n=1 Tax=Priapulus caudatus TaxID=37621 RepID=A0ABM1DZD4_PRICU|nr:PREDICTED: intraflagellar transport protein 81 homolog [Priapulus caudatus]
MSERLKYIVQELNKPPFTKNYNLISFDALEPMQRLQVLNDIFAELDPKNKLDIRQEAADQTAVRMFAVLRALKYKPEEDVNTFRQGLVQGDKSVVYAIMQWCFQRMPELKQRAYLAKFLVKTEVPPEVQQDDEVHMVTGQYSELMETFKEVHKDHEALASSGFSTADIKKDIENMDEEKEQITKRVERVKKKVENTPNKDAMLGVARNLRTEKEREVELTSQRQEQTNALMLAEQRTQRIQQQLKDMRHAGIKTTPEDLMQQLEEETKTNQYLVEQKYPKEIASLQAICTDLQKVASVPAMGQSDLDELNKMIKDLNAQINQLIEKKMLETNDPEDKTALFRQQAAMVSRKKEAAANKLEEARHELSQLETDLEEKKSSLKELDVGDVLRGDDFKRYVAKLRVKNNEYKKKRTELSEVRAEVGILTRSEEILRERDGEIMTDLRRSEEKHGVAGFTDTQEELEQVSAVKSQLDEEKGKTLENISGMVQELHAKIAGKKTSLTPIIKQLRPMRQKCQELTHEFDDKKATYDALATKLESSRSQLEQDVKSLWDEYNGLESKFHLLSCQGEILSVQERKVESEIQAALDPQAKRNSFREQYNRVIAEQEAVGKQLREKQKSIRDNHDGNVKQVKMWTDFLHLMEGKQRISEQHLEGKGDMSHVSSSAGNESADRFVL